MILHDRLIVADLQVILDDRLIVTDLQVILDDRLIVADLQVILDGRPNSVIIDLTVKDSVANLNLVVSVNFF